MKYGIMVQIMGSIGVEVDTSYPQFLRDTRACVPVRVKARNRYLVERFGPGAWVGEGHFVDKSEEVILGLLHGILPWRARVAPPLTTANSTLAGIWWIPVGWGFEVLVGGSGWEGDIWHPLMPEFHGHENI